MGFHVHEEHIQEYPVRPVVKETLIHIAGGMKEMHLRRCRYYVCKYQR